MSKSKAAEILASKESFTLEESLMIARDFGLMVRIGSGFIGCEWWPHPMSYGETKVSAKFVFNPADGSFDEIAAGASNVVSSVLREMIRQGVA